MHLDVRHLRVVLAVADSGSVSSAAAVLGISQPALSGQLGRIERTLGGALFARTNAGVEPTAIGRHVVDRARMLVDELDDLVREAQRHSTGARLLRIGTNSPRFAAYLMVELEGAGLQRDVVPKIDVSTTVLTEQLLGGELDLAFCGVHVGFGDECPRGLREYVVVESEPFLVAVSSRHRHAALTEIPLSELGDDAWLLPPGRADGTHAALRAAFHDAGISPVSPLGSQPGFWPYVATGKAVAIATSLTPVTPDVVLRPMTGAPLVGRRVLWWHPDRVSDADALVVAVATARAFNANLASTGMTHPWWQESPSTRPRVVDSFS